MMSEYQETLAAAAVRRQQIAAAYERERLSTNECAQRWGLSQSRIRQILAREGVPMRAKSRHHKRTAAV